MKRCALQDSNVGVGQPRAALVILTDCSRVVHTDLSLETGQVPAFEFLVGVKLDGHAHD